MEPKTVLLVTKRVLTGTNKGSSKGSPMGTAGEPFHVLDSVAVTLNAQVPVLFPPSKGDLRGLWRGAEL